MIPDLQIRMILMAQTKAQQEQVQAQAKKAMKA